MAKKTKPEAQYGLAKSNGDKCEHCKWFELHMQNKCDIVEGSISASGWCKYWHGNARRSHSAVRETDNRDAIARMRSYV